jgi:hypothetical protein
MTRDDEIVNRSIDYGQKTQSEYDDGRYDLFDLEWAFEEGAKWADSTMVEKAVEWLSLNAELYGAFNGGKLNEMVCNLIKEIKE